MASLADADAESPAVTAVKAEYGVDSGPLSLSEMNDFAVIAGDEAMAAFRTALYRSN